MSDLEFATADGPLRVTRSDRAPDDPGELVVIAQPAQYRRVLSIPLFGLDVDIIPARPPVDADQPVSLALRWVGPGSAPASFDALAAEHLHESSWQLQSVTQDFEGIQLGFRTVGDDEELGVAVLDLLAADGWESSRESADDPISTTHVGAHGTLDVELFADEERRFLVVIAYLPIEIPTSRIDEIGELALRLSSIMDIGSVDVDVDVGSARVRSAVDLDGVPITRAMIRNTLQAAVVQGDLFLPAFTAVLDGMSARAALDLIVPDQAS
jgi:hypothetical protein